MLAFVISTLVIVKCPSTLTSIIELPSLLPLKVESITERDVIPWALTALLQSAVVLLRLKPSLFPASRASPVEVITKSSIATEVVPRTTTAMFESLIINEL